MKKVKLANLDLPGLGEFEVKLGHRGHVVLKGRKGTLVPLDLLALLEKEEKLVVTGVMLQTLP